MITPHRSRTRELFAVAAALCTATIGVLVLVGWAADVAALTGAAPALATVVTVLAVLVFWTAERVVRSEAGRAAAAEALHASEERYRALTDALPHMVWTMRPDRALEFLNHFAVQFIDRTVAEVNATGWAALIHPDDRAGVLAAVSGPLERGEPHGAEYRLRHRTGEYRWVVSRAVPLKGAGGAVAQWVGSTIDVHDRRTAEDRLRASERRLRAVVQATPQVIWTTGASGREAAEWWAARTGQTDDEAAGLGWLDAVHPDDRERVRAAWARAWDTREPFDAEYRVRTRSGEYRHFAARGVALRDPGGALEEWVGTLTDIHDRKSAEETLREFNATLERRVTDRTRELEEAERRFRAIFHSQFQFIGLMAPDGTLLEANRAALASAGATEADVLGRPFWETVWWAHDPEQQERLRGAVRRAAAGERARFEASHPTADGGVVWVDFSLTPFVDGGAVRFLIPEGRDITERKRVEAALRANEELLRQFVTYAPAAIAMLDRDMRYLRVSDRWLTDYHLDGQEVIGRSHYEVFSDIPQRWKEIHARVLAGTVEACADDPFPRADGGVEWLQWEARPWREADGAIGGLIFFTQVITARKRIEAEVRESEERLEMALTASGMGVWEWDVPTNSVFWSDQCHRIAGGPFDGTLRSFTDAIHPDDRARVWAAVEAALGARTEYAAEFRVLRPDGEVRWLSNVGRASYDATGAPTRMVGLVQDVTERKRAEDAVRESEERFRTAFDHAPIGMALVAPDGRWLRVNRSVCDIVGYPEPELLATDFQAITHPDDLNADLDLVRQMLSGAISTYQTEKRYVHKRGHVVHALLSVSLVRDGGKPLYFVSQIKDITGRKEAEQALQVSEERFRMLFEQSSDAHLIFGATEGIIDCNNAAVAMLRCADKRQVLALHPAELSPEFQPDGRRSLEKCVEMDGLARRNGHHRFDWRHRRFDGEVFPCEVTLTPVELRGRPALLVVWHDLTERQQAEDRIRASLREKEVLLKEIHHRVKNNLQIVSTLLDLQSDYTTDAGALEMFRESRGRVKSMALIHERLYRSEDVARVNFAEYLRQLADDLYRAYRVSDDDIRLELEVDIAPLPIDIAIPCGLLLNELMSNCFKHAFKGATGGVLRVSLTGAGGGNTLVVSDDGVGFPAGTDFRNTASFGLQLVNTLVEQLNGTIELTADRGTAFTVRFRSDRTGPARNPT